MPKMKKSKRETAYNSLDYLDELVAEARAYTDDTIKLKTKEVNTLADEIVATSRFLRKLMEKNNGKK